jgi:hypothetical protein
MPNLSPLTLQCACGDVEIALTGDPVVHLYCHCDHCQVVHGAAMAATAIYRSSDVTITRGEPRIWRLVSTPRYSCANCGVRLFAQGSEEHWGINAYLLPEGLFRPSLHIYCKFARLPVVDALPHFATVPARWGGSDETLAWPAPVSGAGVPGSMLPS